jgi:TPM domain
VRTRITAALVAVLALLSWMWALGAPALATGPVRLSGEITDQAGALGDRRGDVQAAITRLYDQDRVKLYVVYVPSFSRLSPAAWINQTATLNRLGVRDVLLGVATSDRGYAISADPAMGLSATQLDSISSIAIEPALRESDWAAAAIGAAHGVAAVAAGRPVPAPSLSTAVAPGPGSVAGTPLPASRAAADGLTGTEWGAIAGAGALLIGVLLFAGIELSRRRGRAPAYAEQPPQPSTADLEAQASSALVVTDDAVKTSEQELGFAVARFGEHAAAPFSAALDAARAELAAAFKVRQLLDDDIPETEPIRRSMLAEISGRCAEANRLLDEQSQAFDELQDLETRAPEVLAEVDHHVTQQDARAGRSEEVLTRLAAKYTPEAVAVVLSSPGQARERLEFARGRLAEARQALAAGSAGEAAVSLQAAESAADQAESLLAGIEHMEAELTQAASALPAALREIDAVIAEATAAPAGAPGAPDGRAAAIARGQAAAAGVRDQLAAQRPFDTLTALRHVEQAGAELDHSLAGARAARARQDRARAVLDQAMLVARSSVTAAEDFVTTRRGGVGAAARTRLAEAHRHFRQAVAFSAGNPEAALAEAQQADVLGQQARALAEHDVASFSRAEPGPILHGGIGGGFAGAILGGILINSLFGGRRGHGGSGRGPGGGSGLGGLGPGSFGGIGTRGRHSIGGRF